MKTFVCAALFAVFCGGSLAAEIARPNILFAIADDWGLHAGAYGTRWVKTPAFDRIAREGLLFLNAYTPVAKCAASRACVLTGRHLWQNEEAGNHLAFFPTKLKSWPEVLMTEGWHVGITGKGWSPGIANDTEGKPRLITGKPFNQRKADRPTKGISNTDYAANFNDFLYAAPKDAPWCFWYGSQEPHRDYEFQSGANKENEGRSFAPVLKNPEMEWNHPTLTTYLLKNHSLTDGRDRYTWYGGRTDGAEQLYDHSTDPLEHKNLATNPESKEIIARLKKFLPTHDEPNSPRNGAAEGDKATRKDGKPDDDE